MDDGMSEAMFVRCPMCDTEQESMIQMDRISFENSTLSGNSQTCRKCRTPVLLSNDTVFFKKL